MLKDFDKNHDALKHILETADLVVWDDIAASKLSDYDVTQLLSIIDMRISEEKANIYTGNITSHEALVKAVGSRLASRIWNCSEIIEFQGRDRRK